MVKNKFTKILVTLVVILMIIQVVVSNRLSTMGARIERTVRERELIKQENEILTLKIASMSALLHVSQKATELGFVKYPFYYYIKHKLSIALKSDL